MSEHLPILMVLVPLLSAPLVVFIKHRKASRVIATLACALSACAAWTLALQMSSAVSYPLGGWRPAIGIELRVDFAGAYVAAIVSTIATFAISLGTRGTREDVVGREMFFYAAFLMCVAGLMGMVVTGDAFNVFVFLEISSLSTYTLVAMGKERRALTAALNYLFLGTLGGTFVLIGIGLMYQMTGTLNAAAVSARIREVEHLRTTHVAFAFLAVGLGIKLAVFPLHQWLPGAYSQAPHAVSSFLAGTATKVMYFQLIRVVVSFFGVAYVFDTLHFGDFLLPLSLVAMFAGSLSAIFQPSLRRLLAYSSIGQVGYLTLALSLGTEAGLNAGLLHLGAHAVTKTALFLIAAAFIAQVGDDRLDRLSGLGKRYPLLSLGFVLGGLSLIGVPGTVGFVSKWALLEAVLAGGRPWLAFLILASSMLAVVYVFRVVEVLYFRAPLANAPPLARERADWGSWVPAGLLVLVSVGLGVWSELPSEYVATAAQSLFGGAR
ncbi:MAG: monovalent cation/H+ antiporter subunit D family protein [Myxococcales bacterium]|nr:monovalent cation/H+ antiporter subunit D family protein [Myxococcales bacterium]MCB9628470.1 monovalent cation/H+ antiporter subunit D family protein [Sandaracinaceae bacterium]